MRCAWDALLAVLPQWMRAQVDALGRDTLQEVRLRAGEPPELILHGGMRRLSRKAVQEDLSFSVSAASRYSPWNQASAAQGYLTAPGGHRIGLCGEAVVKNGEMTGFRRITGLCIRVARDFPGIAARAADVHGSVLILGSPGSGKTTLLRDLARLRAERETVAVVDERGELFPENAAGFSRGVHMDVLSGCAKRQGVELLLRCMGPQCIAVDEITAASDCEALLQAGWCGVTLLATAHARDRTDLLRRPVYRPLAESRLFGTLLVLAQDKSWHMERMEG